MTPKNKPQGKEKTAATGDKQPTAQELALQHTVYYNASTSEIKDDLAQLASCWKSGHGALTKQEAGLLLWHHCHRGEDGQAEILAAGVINTCLGLLDTEDALAAEKSISAGILLTLCQADVQNKDAVARAKAGQTLCFQVLHKCISHPACTPRHVIALLASLASSPMSLAALLKTLQGDLPWSNYCCLLEKSHGDHMTAINVADYVRYLVTEHPELAAEAGSNGLLPALLDSAKHHKSAAAVAAAAASLQAMCEAAPDNRSKLGQLPGAIQLLVDLLGPPPSTIIAWEQQEYKHILNPPPPPQQQASQMSVTLNPQGSCSELQLPAPSKAWNRAASAKSMPGSMATGGSRTLEKVGGSTVSMTPRRTGTGALEESGPAGRVPKASTTGSIKPAKSVQLQDMGPGDGEGSMTSVPSEAKAPDQQCLNSKQSLARQAGSSTGTDGAIAAGRHQQTRDPRRQSQGSCTAVETFSSLPHPAQPLLCKNSTSLKWDGPVPDATRSAVAGVLAELVLLPDLCKAVHDRLAASRLAALLQAAMKAVEEGGGKKGAKAKKKKSASLTLTPECEVYLCHLCVCLKLLVAADNSDCYRVAATGCLPALVQLAAGSKHARLRQTAKAVLSQVCMLAEVHEQLKQAEVPEEMQVKVPMRLVDEELKQLQIEFPSAQLQRLDDVTARART